MNATLPHATVRPTSSQTPSQPCMFARILTSFDPHSFNNLVVIAGTLLASIFSTTLLLADSSPSAETNELRLLLLPLLGSLIASAGAYMLAPKEEIRKVAGRCIYAVACGTTAPVIYGATTASGALLLQHPVAMFLAGLVATTVFYIFLKPIIERMFTSAPQVADSAIEQAKRRIGLTSSPDNSNQQQPPTP